VIIFSLDNDGAITVPSLGSYTDTIVKTDAGWRFEKRVMRADLGTFGRNPSPTLPDSGEGVSG
jgi:hypothetical protein